MTHSTLYPILVLVVTLFYACTPKTSDPVTATVPVEAPTPVEENLSPCPKFTDAPNPGRVEDNYVIYRDFLRTQQLTKSYNLWKQVHAIAPAADGKRNTVMTDGIYFMEYFMSQTTDTTLQRRYRDTVFQLYAQIEACYPTGMSMKGRYIFDCFFKYDYCGKPKRELYDMIKEIVQAEGMETPYYLINPFTSLVADLHESGELTSATAREDVAFLKARVANGQASAKTEDDKASWAIIANYVPQRLAYFETVPGFYGCAYYQDKYLSFDVSTTTDCQLLAQTAGYLKFGGCTSTDADYQAVLDRYNALCRQRDEDSPFDMLRDGNYPGAVKGFTERYESSDNESKKAEYALLIAKINYSPLRKYSESRKWARRAAGHRSGWGEPYLLIGKLYASSGPLCGSGTGFNSQRVVWVAIDQWNKAKSVDPGARTEANQLINKYAQYMPSGEDLFSRTLKEGSTYTIPCWINEQTIVRAAP